MIVKIPTGLNHDFPKTKGENGKKNTEKSLHILMLKQRAASGSGWKRKPDVVSSPMLFGESMGWIEGRVTVI